MGTEYGVGTQNPFDLLDDEAPESSPQDESGDKSQASARGGRGGKKPARGGRGGAVAAAPAAATEAPKPKKREFDRHSGSGRGKEVAKGGRGKHNWGGNEASDNVAEEAAPAEVAVASEETAEAAPEAAAQAEEEDNAKGYEEYLASIEQKRPAEDLSLAPREAIADDKTFKKGKVLQPKDEEPLFGDVVKERSSGKQAKSKEKKAVSLDEFVAANPSAAGDRSERDFDAPRGGRGGEFRGRGGRGRGGEFRGRGRGGASGAPAAGAPAGAGAPTGEFRGGRGRGGERGRGGRGGRGGEFRGGARGGRGSRGGTRGVDISDKDLFPSLGGK